ncbi:MAG: competence/damage-inducible protein A [Bdellovibrionales bacterium]|nr:competence/damage-inducible protein A [Bdellovibrionales bacterium]
MPRTLSVLTIGSEILDGRVQDTNANYIAQELIACGLSASQFHTCDDDLSAIVNALAFLFRASDAVVITGGLGPTDDDLTREAVAAFCGQELIESPDVLAHLKAYFQRKRRTLDPSNNKQALIPEGATIIPNPVGSAPGFIVEASFEGREIALCALPGVPRELKPMLKADVVPYLCGRLQRGSAPARSALRLFGLPEAEVGSRLTCLSFPSDLKLSYRAHFPEIQLLFSADTTEVVLDAVARARTALGEEFIFSNDIAVGLEEAVHRLLIEKQQTLALAESCTGGMVGSMVTRTSGSSAYFLGGVVSYSNQAKKSLLGVDAEILTRFGAVSHETAKQMAEGARTRFVSDIAISVTGIAGPEGGTQDKPVGTFYLGLATERGTQTLKFFFDGTREGVRRYAAFCALDLLRRQLLELPAPARAEEVRLP